MRLTVKTVDSKDYKFLYKLLKLRKKEENISHKKIPSFKEHCLFNNSKPYKCDWIIFIEKYPVGRLYISWREELGIHCLPNIDLSIVLDELWNFLPPHVYFNVSPKNKILINYLERKKLKLIQYTYEKQNIC